MLLFRLQAKLASKVMFLVNQLVLLSINKRMPLDHSMVSIYFE